MKKQVFCEVIFFMLKSAEVHTELAEDVTSVNVDNQIPGHWMGFIEGTEET